MRIVLSIVLIFVAMTVWAQEDAPAIPDAEPEISDEGPMTLARLHDILRVIDPEARAQGNGVELTIEDIPVLVIADPANDRMRAMVPIRSAAGIDPEEMLRLMQANFDSALDARYAVAQGRLWGVFIHPLAPLERVQLVSGLVQTINLARTYGSAYSGGAVHFGGGDTGEIYRRLLEELLEKGQEL